MAHQDVTYQLESWVEYSNDAQELWFEEYQEIIKEKNRLPFEVDKNKYIIGEQAGSLQILTARIEGKIIGHIVTWIYYAPHHASVLYGCVSTFYLSKKYRCAGIGKKMIQKSEQSLGQRGVKKFFFMTESSDAMDRFFRILGFEKTYAIYEKWIDNGH